VARTLATRTVTTWFAGLSFDKQQEALTGLQAQHDEAKAVKRAELQKQLAELGYAPGPRRGRPPKAVGALTATTGNGRRKRRGAVKAKYRDPKTGETWSGRGRMASWLKAKVDGGEKAEKYLIA
jgi:DNA-binding protein H-NS